MDHEKTKMDLQTLAECVAQLYMLESKEEKREHLVKAFKALDRLKENFDEMSKEEKGISWTLFLTELAKAGIKFGAQELFQLVGNLI